MKKIKLPIIIFLTLILLFFLQSVFFSVLGLKDKPLTFGSIESPLGMKNDVPAGGISILDFEKPVEENILIKELKIISNADTNDIRLKVWRLKGDTYEAVAESKLFKLTKGGNTFPVDNVFAKKGDFLGLYMKSSEVDRTLNHRFKGRIYVVGDLDAILKDTGAHDAQAGYAFLVSGIAPPDDSQIENRAVGSIESPLGMKNDVPPGGVSVLDFEKPVDADISINEVKALSNADSNEVRLKVWRLNGNVYEAVAESKPLVLVKGVNKIHIDNILAKKGDFLGLYMKTSELDRSKKHTAQGRVYAVGDLKEIQKDTKAHDGQTGYTFSVHGTSPI